MKYLTLSPILLLSGNYSLSRVLPQIYAVKKEPIHDHVMTLVSLLPQCDTNEKLGLLMLFSLVAKNRPAVNMYRFMVVDFINLISFMLRCILVYLCFKKLFHVIVRLTSLMFLVLLHGETSVKFCFDVYYHIISL